MHDSARSRIACDNNRRTLPRLGGRTARPSRVLGTSPLNQIDPRSDWAVDRTFLGDWPRPASEAMSFPAGSELRALERVKDSYR
jgi:hypothetical protein